MRSVRLALASSLILIFTHCNDGTITGGQVQTGTPSSCSVQQIPTGAVITCTGQDPVTIENGSNGIGAGIYTTAAAENACLAGGVNIITFQDLNNNGTQDSGEATTSQTLLCNGTNGQDGQAGQNGTNGTSFSVTQTLATAEECPTGGILLTTESSDASGKLDSTTTQSTVVCSGATGATGAQGATGASATFSPVVPIMPCGANSSAFKEVLLCYQGKILSDFSGSLSGQDTRLAFIPAGTYEDSDESGCIFNVAQATDGISLVVSWSAGNNANATWSADSVTCQAPASK